ncbi:MAG: hypothetical protein KKB50_01790 [Planctomycetes bacterium]|nr:hypothetical protein [Planctomycetota bacterium]
MLGLTQFDFSSLQGIFNSIQQFVQDTGGLLLVGAVLFGYLGWFFMRRFGGGD